ncbi:MAG: hypothetical protein KGL90_09130 [Burkholderiales bacterium]|nr:hypothetical protein [Burkholderiales bacterium]
MSLRHGLVRHQGLLGLLLLTLLVVPFVRHALESSMARHMLIEFPSVMLAGGLLITACPTKWRMRLRIWNELGITGLLASALVLAVLMIPRVLDLALVDERIEHLKLAALILSGATLRSSWSAAGIVVQGFFLGNVLPMMAIVGLLYQDSTLRLCNAYRLDDQQNLGVGLVCLAVGVALVWLGTLARRLMLSEPALAHGQGDCTPSRF